MARRKEVWENMMESQPQRSIYRKLVVCSALINPIRRWVPDFAHIWLYRFLKGPIHTFAIDVNSTPTTSEKHQNYWYCAGDYLSEDDASVTQQLLDVNLTYAKCLIASNIKDEHVSRPELVARGRYSIHYLCHNLTNRILFACRGAPTLADLDIPCYGYEIVARTKLSVYGKNQAEWYKRVQRCHQHPSMHRKSDVKPKVGGVEPFAVAGPNDIPNNYRAEVDKLRRKAAISDVEYQNFTIALENIDFRFYKRTGFIMDRFDSGEFGEDKFNRLMVDATKVLLKETLKEVGEEATRRLYPNIILEHEPPERRVVAKVKVVCDEHDELPKKMREG